MGFPTITRRPYAWRSSRKNRFVLCGAAVCIWIIIYQAMVQSTRLYKFIPVDFRVSARYREWLANNDHKMPVKAIRERVGEGGVNFDDRYFYLRSLAAGLEGVTDLYNDKLADRVVVVKTYNSVSLNPLPSMLFDRYENHAYYWPAEIPAMQFVGGGLENASIGRATPRKVGEERVGFLPLIDYFITTEPVRTSWKWHLVTPYMLGGTLADLSYQLVGLEKSPSELDHILRPSFIQFLHNLQDLHNEGFCHNDVKPSNIFMREAGYNNLSKNNKNLSLPRQWIIGDFGQVREITHRYHNTAAFRMENQWNDCRANDARRALKTYLWLLRQASGGHEFDNKFYFMQESWSKLYWDFISSLGGLTDLLAMIQRNNADADTDADAHDSYTTSSTDHESMLENVLTSNSKVLSIAITRELRCTTQKTSWADWWMLGGLLPKAKVESNPFIT